MAVWDKKEKGENVRKGEMCPDRGERKKKTAFPRAWMGCFTLCSSPETKFFFLFYRLVFTQFNNKIDCSGG